MRIVAVDEDNGLAGLCMCTGKMQRQVLKGSGMIAAVNYICIYIHINRPEVELQIILGVARC